MVRRFLFFTIIGAMIIVAFGLLIIAPFPSSRPEFKSGDLIFQTSVNNQTPAIALATLSLYTHVGMIRVENGVPKVLDSAGKVKYQSLDDWLTQGYGRRYAVYRHARLNNTEAGVLMDVADRYIGREYDRYFSFRNRSLYCSELPFLAFRGIGRDIGKEERIGDLWLNNPYTQELIARRWSGHPLCRDTNDKDVCYARIMDEPVITPTALAGDKDMKLIFSNYLGGLL